MFRFIVLLFLTFCVFCLPSSKTDEQILKPAAVVRPHRFSDNEDECTEDSDRSEIKCSVKLPSNLQDDRKTQTPVPYKRNKINQAENKPRSLQISNVNVQLVNGAVAKQQVRFLSLNILEIFVVQ